MPPRIDVKTGDRFGRLVIVEEVEQTNNVRRFQCMCDCGNIKSVSLSKLRTGNTKSCGCFQKEVRGTYSITHKQSKKRIYRIWHSMKSRCLNENSTIYKHYGGRGITVCDEWLEFEPFWDWAFRSGYSDNLTIERKNVNGNYEPGNCCWVSKEDQKFNKRNTFFVELNGVVKPLKKWAEIYNVPYVVAFKRIRRGWDANRALTEPVKNSGHSI